MGLRENTYHAFEQHAALSTLFGLLILVVFLSRTFLSSKDDPREPPIIQHRIPYIGHIIGMFWHGAAYFDFVKEKHDYPIFTLPTLNGRTYIITAPDLAAQIQRASKSVSFYSAILEVTRRLCGFDESSMTTIWKNANGDEGEFGVMPDTHRMMASVLGPGPVLNDSTKLQLEIITELMAGFKPGHGENVDLLAWLREQFTIANARAIYGPENIFSVHPGLIKDFWTFEQGIMGLLIDIVPSITARKAYLARLRVFAGLVEYVKNGSHNKASRMIQQRVSINLKYGITPEMAGNAELIMHFAILGNAVPTAFWMLANIYSRPELLREVRREIEKAVTVRGESSTGGKAETRTIHVEKLKAVAPVLVSCFRETLRMVANLTSVRAILEDTMLADKYLLKKGSIVQVASGILHKDEDTWGADALEFNPRRFVAETSPEAERSTSATVPLPKNIPSAAFRAFGGGSVICPGRHFAQSEIVGFAALMVMGFDIEGPGGGTMQLPKTNNRVIPLAVMKPTDECRVNIKRRVQPERVEWELDL